jgi:excinuclease UvrABC ATPase subunit
MRTEVREALLAISVDFKEFLGLQDLDVLDITISGSNAAYTYTPTSDIDLHLVVMIPEAHDPELRELFDAKKYQYNDQHNIKIRGFDVELYVQDVEQEHHSMGIYSVKNNKWVSIPRAQKAEIDDVSVEQKFETYKERVRRALLSDDMNLVRSLIDNISNMRKTGLARGGEFSPENLAFKMLRTSSEIQKLRNHWNDLKDRKLGLESAS